MGALSHVRVLDFTHHIAGPMCTKQLAALGAEVIKVERPGAGDPARAQGPFPNDEPHPEKSGLFLYLNTGKKGITLNLKDPAAKGLLRTLIAEADVVVENFRPGVMDRLGLGYGALRRLNRRVVLVSISNFGQTGPYRDYQASDLVAYATGGLMYTTGAYDREPLKHGLTVAQMMAGLSGAVAAMTALTARHLTGAGQHADISIQEAVIQSQGSYALWYSYNGSIHRRQPKSGSGLGNIMPCKDGHVVVMPSADWQLLVDYTGIKELAAPAYADAGTRSAHFAEIDALLLPWLAKGGKHELFHSAQEWRMPWAVVQDSRDLYACPQLAARDFFVELEHPVAGTYRYPGAPMNLTETPWQVGPRAPLLGEHNEEVYCGRLGVPKERLAALRQAGVI